MFNITGGAGNDAITGGSGNDTITGGSGNDSITGGGGADTIVVGLGVNTLNYTTASGSLVAAMDTISGIKTNDLFKIGHALSGGSVLTGSATGSGSLSADIGMATSAISFAANAAALISITGAGAGSYLVINDSVAGYDASNDVVVRLVSPPTLTAINFII
jgi:Ca2+-binding RTX toxin-like protein